LKVRGVLIEPYAQNLKRADAKDSPFPFDRRDLLEPMTLAWEISIATARSYSGADGAAECPVCSRNDRSKRIDAMTVRRYLMGLRNL